MPYTHDLSTAGASRGEQGSKQCGAPDFFDGLGPWACQEAAGWEKLAKNSQAGPGGGCVTEAAIGTRSLVTGVKFFFSRETVKAHTVNERFLTLLSSLLSS